jgi:hypothetical protein
MSYTSAWHKGLFREYFYVGSMHKLLYRWALFIWRRGCPLYDRELKLCLWLIFYLFIIYLCLFIYLFLLQEICAIQVYEWSDSMCVPLVLETTE